MQSPGGSLWASYEITSQPDPIAHSSTAGTREPLDHAAVHRSPIDDNVQAGVAHDHAPKTRPGDRLVRAPKLIWSMPIRQRTPIEYRIQIEIKSAVSSPS